MSSADAANVFVDSDPRANAAGPITDQNDTTTTCNYYSQWSEKYEVDMEQSSYNGPRRVVESFVQLNLDRNVRILDLLAGTGLVAQLLANHGYTNIDAIDGSDDMLHLSKAKNLHKNYIVSYLGNGIQTPIESETYDAIVASGCFAPGHLYADVLPELLRVVKKGGIIAWAMRKNYSEESEKFINFENEVQTLVDQQIWRHFVARREISQYLLGHDGYVYIMQKI